MTSPRHAESTAIGRYYTHPVTGQRLVSVTNALSVAMAKPALVPWAAKVVAEHTLDHLPTIVARSRTEDRELLRKEISSQVTVARDKAADLGSRIHALAEAYVTGRELPWEDGDDEAHPYVEQYLRFLADFEVDLDRDIVAAEMTVAHPGLGYAGTLDLIVRLGIGIEHTADGLKPYKVEPGQDRIPSMVDFKTSATRPATSVYPEYALQIAGLRDAKEAWLPNDTVDAMPGVAAGYVLNLRRTTYALIPMPFGTAERNAFRSAVGIAQWVHDDPTGPLRPVLPTGRVQPKATRKTAVKKTTAAKTATPRKVA